MKLAMIDLNQGKLTALPSHKGIGAKSSVIHSLQCCNVTKRFGKFSALRGVNLTLFPGQLVALLGPSGSGKTTLGEILTGTSRPDEGAVFLEGRDVTNLPAHKRRIPMVPQEWDLFPHLTALENVEFGLRVAGYSRRQRREVALTLLDQVGLAHRATAMPHQLSGGQQQRVAFARALATPSRYLVLDEPFANVDQDTRSVLRTLILDSARAGRGILFITHDQRDALSVADQIICLIDGTLEMAGTPEEVYAQPTSLEVALLTGEAFLVPLIFDTDGDGCARFLGAPDAAKPVPVSGSALRIVKTTDAVVRPGWLQVVGKNNIFNVAGRVSAMRYLGAHYLLEVVTEQCTLWVEAQCPCEVGSRVFLAVRQGIHLPLTKPQLDQPPAFRDLQAMEARI